MSRPSGQAWEEWQLTAYLLNELEPVDAERIKVAAAHDPAIAQQLAELSATIGSVQSALAKEPLTASDQAALARLQAASSQLCDSPVAPRKHDWPVAVAWSRRLVSRWENWASLAGLILIAVVLWQRQPAVPDLALNFKREPVKAAPSSAIASSPSVDSSAVGLPGALGDTTLDDTSHPIHQGLHKAEAELLGVPLNSAATGAEFTVADAESADTNKNNGHWSAAGGMMGGSGIDGGMGLGSGLGSGMSAGGMMGGNGAAEELLSEAIGPGAPAPGLTAPALPAASGPALAADSKQLSQLNANVAAQASPSPSALAAGGPDRFEELSAAAGRNEFRLVPFSSSPSDGKAAPLHEEAEGREVPFLTVPAPAAGGDRFNQITDNPFKPVRQDPLSTFSIDVDTASFSKVRQYLMEYNQAPPPDAVRIEEFVNSFDYQYAGPQDDKPFAAALAVSDCPWTPEHKLVRIALQAKQVDVRERPKANLVFLLDVSGSMNEPNKLPLVKETIRLLTYQLQENDRVAMVVYAGAAGCVLSSTPGNRQDEILSAIDRLSAGGSTNGGQGIQLAYSIAREHFIPGGVNRVILCTDGDFNVGLTGTQQLVDLVKEQAASNVFLTVLGYGMGNTNDAMMEQIADKGNGVYGFVDTRREAQRQMVKQLAGNLITVAKDVKIQVEFNPSKIREYRLLGYENRIMAHEDFNNDKKDAGEIGAGHRVTALYEVALVGSPEPKPQIDGLRYQTVQAQPPEAPAEPVLTGEASHELLAVKLRYKQPEGSESQLLVFPLEDKVIPFDQADTDFRWAAAMAEFGMLLRNSPHRGQANWNKLFDRARAAAGSLEPARAETLEMIRKAWQLVPR